MDIHHELITPDLRATSRVVAEKFGKRHANVLRDIENIRKEVPPEFTELNFEFSEYLDSTGRTLPMFELTRDGFVLLAMGFTGAAAMEWKVRFIEAFNMMEAELAARTAVGDAELRSPVVPSRFGEDLGTREKITMIRETRLLHGIPAGRRMWAMLDMPDVTGRGQIGLLANPEDGRACLTYLLGLEIGGRAVSDWVADGQDDAALNRVGLRVQGDGLFVGNPTPVFAGSRWAGGQHRIVLAALDGVQVGAGLTLLSQRQRGLIIPLATIAGGVHAIR